MRVVVTGGGTIAPIDDVRRIANISTGRFSASIAEACLQRGAEVWHVHAESAQLPFQRAALFHLDSAEPQAEVDRLLRLRDAWLGIRDRLHLLPLKHGTVNDYRETLKSLLTAQPIDVAFLAMAVSDFEPIPVHGKLDSRSERVSIACRATPKVIREVRDWSPQVYLVGFKLLAGATVPELIAAAEAAGLANRADLTVANDWSTVHGERHTIHLVRAGLPAETYSGDDVAKRLVDRAFTWAQPALAPRRASAANC